MKKLLFATAAAAALVVSPSFAADGGTVVHGGQILSDLIAWGATAFGTALAALGTAVVYKFLGKLGIETTQQQKDMLNSVILNGLNDAAAKAQASVGANAALDANVRSGIVANAVTYTQAHASDTIRALGLDPKSGQAVEAIKARMATLVADETKPTDPILTPAVVGQGAPAASLRR